MSGFIGILNGDRRPVSQKLLVQMTEFLSPQGPDALDIWREGHVGLGHTLLRTTWDAKNEHQPHSLDGKVWITGDIRLDHRDELIESLGHPEPTNKSEIPDVELVLHAYQCWGESCLGHFTGDFAFVIWDGPQQRLFCARDQFGIVPFYYAVIHSSADQDLIFSNNLSCLHLHPNISEHLNEYAIGDFLLFGMNMDRASTTFTDIQKLPPAHSLVWSDGKVQVRQYWQLPERVEYLRYKNPQDYLEQFRELFERSIADRLRTDRAGTYLSGGMDSTSIAAIAYRLMKENNSSVDFRAYTIIYKHLLEDDEGEYAAQVAEKSGFPVEYLVADDFIKQPPEEYPVHKYPEPLLIPTQVAEVEITRRVSEYSRVLFAGFGGDPALYPSTTYWSQLLKTGQFHYFFGELWGYFQRFRRLPRVGLRSRLRKLRSKKSQTFEVPDWVNPDFAARVNLKAQLETRLTAPPQTDRYGMVTAPLWSNIFAGSAPGCSGFPVKIRFPFFDVQLATFLLSVPHVPWFENKYLLREAMQGILPDSVRLRPKTTLRGFAQFNLAKKQGLQPWMVALLQNPLLEKYVSNDTENFIQHLTQVALSSSYQYNRLALSAQLSYWLLHRNS